VAGNGQRLLGTEEDCFGTYIWTVVLEEVEKTHLRLIKHHVMKMYGRVKAFSTSPLSRAKWMVSCIS
jgi:hypothetical protein